MGNACCNGGTASRDQPTHNEEFLLSTGISLNPPQEIAKKGVSSILVYGGKQDPRGYVKQYLIYSFYIHKYSGKEWNYQQKFKEFMTKNEKSQNFQKFLTFDKLYKDQADDMKKSNLLLKYVFQEPSLLNTINKTLRQTDDPKILGYLMFPLSRLNQAIKKNYKVQQGNNKKRDEIYVVMALSKQEIKLLQKIKQQNIILSFRSFEKGFTTEKAARKGMKQMKEKAENKDKIVVLMIIHFSKLERLEESLDSGYYKKADAKTDEESIMFNIFQGFRVDSSDSDNEFNLTYSYLSQLYHTRYVDRQTTVDDSALQIFNICNSISKHYLKTQSSLLRIIKTEQASINISQKLTNHSESKRPKDTSNIQQVQNLINNYIDQGNYEEALKLANQFQNSFLIKAKKLETLYKSGKKEETKKLLEELLKSPQKQKKQNSEADETIEFIAVQIQIENNQKGKAKDRLKKLHKKMVDKYSDGYEVIGKDVIGCLQKLYGVEEIQKYQQDLIKSHHEQRRNIELSDLNLRGISTTI